MFHFLHTYTPQPILISFGPINVYWYGIFIVLGLLAAIYVSFKIADLYGLKKDVIVDLAFYLILGGIAGARLYHVILEFSYYRANLLEILKPWHGGLAIHGGLIAGLIIIYWFSHRQKLGFALTAALLAPGVVLAQAIGRFGNYFNQEIFGLPTNLPWGIPIEPAGRPAEYQIFSYFHPAFLYEGLGNLLLFGLLIYLHYRRGNGKRTDPVSIMAVYLIGYSLLRFGLEYIRLDATPDFFGLRWPQVASLIIVAAAVFALAWRRRIARHNGLAK